MYPNIRPTFIHLNILWEKNKDIEWPDWNTTPYMHDNKEYYLKHIEWPLNVPSIQEEYKEHLETIEYWTDFFKKATIEDMLGNKNSWIMVEPDFTVFDGYHRLTAARLAKKDIVVCTLDTGSWPQGKPTIK